MGCEGIRLNAVWWRVLLGSDRGPEGHVLPGALPRTPCRSLSDDKLTWGLAGESLG